MDLHQYANIEALSNIIVNCVEVLGISVGAANIALGWIPMACGAKGYSSKIYIASISTIVLALTSPMIINTINTMARNSNLELLAFFSVVAGIVLGLTSITLCFALSFSPALIAWREKLPSSGLIIGLTIGSFVLPLLWIAALVVASLAVAKKQNAPIVQLIKERWTSNDQAGSNQAGDHQSAPAPETPNKTDETVIQE